MGAAHQALYCVAVLKHLEPCILEHVRSKRLEERLWSDPIRGFRLGDWLSYIEGLDNTSVLL
jgi:hypothetical protein